MESATLLMADDRCRRMPYLMREWERQKVAALSALYQGIEAGLLYEGEEDPGQVAGDSVYTIAAERGLETAQSDLYGQAQHLAALADILTFFLRAGAVWEKPESVLVGKGTIWESSAWLEASGTRLRRLILVDSWGENRARSEKHSWRTFGEIAAYDMPMIQTVLVIGQHRDGRRHSPWTKAWTHPVNHELRMRKRSGEGFGGKWKPVWREETEYSREMWIDCMRDDGILGDVCFEIEVPTLERHERGKVLNLIERKTAEIQGLKELPDPQPSVCNWPSLCQFEGACWNFETPSERNGFVRVEDVQRSSPVESAL